MWRNICARAGCRNLIGLIRYAARLGKPPFYCSRRCYDAACRVHEREGLGDLSLLGRKLG